MLMFGMKDGVFLGRCRDRGDRDCMVRVLVVVVVVVVVVNAAFATTMMSNDDATITTKRNARLEGDFILIIN